MQEYEPPRIEEIRKLTPEERAKFQAEGIQAWQPYKPDRWERASKHSEIIIIGGVVILLALFLLIMP